MGVKQKYILFIALAVVFFVLLFPKVSLGDYCSTGCPEIYYTQCGEPVQIGQCCDEDCCEKDIFGNCTEWCKVCSCGGSWPEYKCDSPDCDGDILVRHCHSYKGCGPCHMGSCVDECCCVLCSAPEICEDCESWHKPEREPCLCPRWGLIKPECRCKAECIDAPDDPRYYGDPRFYKNPFYPPAECDLEKEWDIYPISEYNPEEKWRMDQDNVYLPVKLDWDDVRGWEDSWKEEGECVCVKECESENRSCIESCGGIEDCKVDCKEDCYKKLKDLTLEKKLREEGLSEYRERYTECLRDCDNECEEKYKSNAGGCSKTCPYPDRCHLAKEYIQSYVIKIEGEMRDCEALRKINGLKQLIEKAEYVTEIEEYKTQIEWIREKELEIPEYEREVLPKSEWIPLCSCMFKSNRTYKWQVKACCSPSGTHCGPWSDWEFTTASVPEPKLPYDPDWPGLFRMKNLTKAEIEKLKWCEIDDQKLYMPTELGDKIYYRPLTYTDLIYYSEEYTLGANEGKEYYLCHPNLEIENRCEPLLLYPIETIKIEYEIGGERVYPFRFWDKDRNYFTKITPYLWKTRACREISALGCTDYSQEWRFSAEDFTLETPKLVNPQNDPAGEIPVGLPVTLTVDAPYAFSFIFEITGLGQIKSQTPNLGLDYGSGPLPLALDTRYTWYATPCWGYESEPEKCEYSAKAGPFHFKTTGELIRVVYPEPGVTEVPIPIKFEWEEVPGAKSYIFTLDGKEPVVLQSTEILVNYPDLRQETQYFWKVQTCARADGTACEAEANQNFTTFRLQAPVNPSPENGAVLPTTELHKFSWDEILGAKFYQFQIGYLKVADGEEKECLEKEGEKIIKIVSENSIYYPLECKGQYQWQVKGCLDEECKEAGIPNAWVFNLVSPTKKETGLVPCGRSYNNPDTPWDETKPCGIRHIFITLKIIVDFLLFRIAPLALVILTLATGILFFFSIKMEAPNPLVKVKSLWKAAGKGFAILFFAWLLLSIIFNLIGYQFGPWWRF